MKKVFTLLTFLFSLQATIHANQVPTPTTPRGQQTVPTNLAPQREIIRQPLTTDQKNSLRKLFVQLQNAMNNIPTP